MSEDFFMNNFFVVLLFSIIIFILIRTIKNKFTVNSFKGFETNKKLINYYKMACLNLYKSKILFFIPFSISVIFIILNQVQRYYWYFNYYSPGSDTTIITTQYIWDQLLTAIKNSPNKLSYGYITSMSTSMIFYGLFLISCLLYPFLIKKIKSFCKEDNSTTFHLLSYLFLFGLISSISGILYSYFVSKNIITVSISVTNIISPLLIVSNHLLFCIAFTLLESFILIYAFFRISNISINYKQIIENSIQIYITFFKFNIIFISFKLIFMALNYAIDLYAGTILQDQIISLSLLKIISYSLSILISITILPAPFILIITPSNLKNLLKNNVSFIITNLKKYIIFIIIGSVFVILPEIITFFIRIIFRNEIIYMIKNIIEPIFKLILSIIFYIAFFQFIKEYFNRYSVDRNTV